jgi:hypothetical protein
MRIIVVVILAATCSGCVTGEKVSFLPTQNQEQIIRDGNPALVSKRQNSIVLIRPAGRQIPSNGRPVFVVGVTNLTKAPITFRVANIEAWQTVNQQQAQLKVFTYEELVAEERTRQVAAAVLVGLAGAANAYSASQAGYYNSNSTVYTPRGTYNVHTTGYSPVAASIAQSNASAQNAAMISNTVERGQQNLAALEASVMKDNTLMPNEWYGGQLHLQPPESDSSASRKSYTVSIKVGPDVHEIEIAQEPVR